MASTLLDPCPVQMLLLCDTLQREAKVAEDQENIVALLAFVEQHAHTFRPSDVTDDFFSFCVNIAFYSTLPICADSFHEILVALSEHKVHVSFLLRCAIAAHGFKRERAKAQAFTFADIDEEVDSYYA